MSQIEKLLRKAANNPRDLAFRELRRLVESCGYKLDIIRGSHHIFRHPLVPDRLNLQPVGKSAKAYQVKQVLEVIQKHNLTKKAEKKL